LIDVIDKPAKEVPDEDDDDATKIYQKYLEECLTTKCIILASMNSELQRKHHDMDPTAIIEHLKKMFELEKLGCKLGKELSQDLILQSLSESFSQFVINFNMNKMDCDLHEMLNMLIDYENQLASEKKKGIVMLVGNSFKKKGKGKSKPKKKPTAPKGGVTKPKGKEGKANQSNVGFQISRKLKNGEVKLQVGNGAKLLC
uniref:Uncharacterized protein LOC104246826 n=1 Tax=Nicotiana sylvestris TaxID=4096 RepID=A0A1U7YP58_NICSY